MDKHHSFHPCRTSDLSFACFWMDNFFSLMFEEINSNQRGNESALVLTLRIALSLGRGALIVFEGCDRAGKSTQVKMLMDALSARNIPTKTQRFPDRRTPIGTIISDFLSKKVELSPESVHLLFSANRWECKEDILKAVNSGTTIIIDRYASSGAAYTAATSGRCLKWCKEPDRGLPCPDIVIYLDISTNSQSSRCDWGEERYENTKLQQQVASNYKKLKDKTWSIINADQDKSIIHTQILEEALKIVEKVKDLPLSKLYEPV